MNVDTVLHAIAKKHRAEFGAASALFDAAASSEITVTITIPEGFVLYILNHGGYTNQSDVLAEFKNAQGELMFDWEEYPDTFFQEAQVPITQEFHQDSLFIIFSNNSSDIASILIMIATLLIPDTEREGFEADILSLAPI